jgi:type IV pilus assembly protein PilO
MELPKVNIDLQQLERIPLKTKAAVLVGVLALIGGLFFYFMYLPQTKVLATQERQLANVMREYNENKAIADNLEEFQEEIRRLNQRFEEALERLPSSADIDQLLIDLPNLAKEEDLVVRLFRPGNQQARGFYAVVPLSLELTGSYNRVAKFIEKVAGLSRIVTVKDVELSPASGADSDSIQLSVRMSAETYTFVEQQTSAAAAPAQGAQGRR